MNIVQRIRPGAESPQPQPVSGNPVAGNPVADDPVADDTVRQALACYKPHARYLLDAHVSLDDAGGRGIGQFSIPESCYIDDTGHLNAVEVNICYNQLLYTFLAEAITTGTVGALSSWTIEEYWRTRLPAVLIVRISTAFRHPVNPKAFAIDIDFSDARSVRRPDGSTAASLSSTFEVSGTGGEAAAGGSALIALVRQEESRGEKPANPEGQR